MKTLFFIFPVFAFLMTTSLSAQINDSGNHSKMLLTTKKSNVLNEVKGTHFLNEEFQNGKVLIKGYDPLDAFLRYNVNTETFEVKLEKTGEEIYELPLNLETQYYIGPDLYTYKTINVDGKSITGYFQNHYEGQKVSFLEKPSLTVTEAVKAKTGYEKDKPAQIKLQEEHYLVFQDGTVKNVDLKEKDFEKAFASTPEVKKYLKDNKLKSAKDFSAMVEWYDKQ